MAIRYFTEASLKFLSRLDKNNNRDWFEQHKQEYEDLVRTPALDFIADMGSTIESLSPHFLAIPKKVGGSMMRPYRDVRFGKDKRPFKTNVGIQFRHFQAKDVHAPGFYLHIEPGGCFVGVGIWHPEAAPLATIRREIDEQPKQWLKVSRAKPFLNLFELTGDSLSNPPRGYKKDHPLIDDLRRKDFIAIAPLDDRRVVTNALKTDVAKSFKTAVPFMQFLCKALEIPF
jgi:uncharacterized protein (TIGR02453 family)